MGTLLWCAGSVYMPVLLCIGCYAHKWTDGTHEKMSYAHVDGGVVIGASGGDGHALFYRLAPGACVVSNDMYVISIERNLFLKMSYLERLMSKPFCFQGQIRFSV